MDITEPLPAAPYRGLLARTAFWGPEFEAASQTRQGECRWWPWSTEAAGRGKGSEVEVEGEGGVEGRGGLRRR